MLYINKWHVLLAHCTEPGKNDWASDQISESSKRQSDDTDLGNAWKIAFCLVLGFSHENLPKICTVPIWVNLGDGTCVNVGDGCSFIF